MSVTFRWDNKEHRWNIEIEKIEDLNSVFDSTER